MLICKHIHVDIHMCCSDWSDVQAAAAEAIWSLIYSNHANHAEAVRRGAYAICVTIINTYLGRT